MTYNSANFDTKKIRLVNVKLMSLYYIESILKTYEVHIDAQFTSLNLPPRPHVKLFEKIGARYLSSLYCVLINQNKFHLIVVHNLCYIV